jgi:hypothetical protein
MSGSMMSNLEIFMAALVAGMLSVLLNGCGVSRYSASTVAKYKVTTPDGVSHEFFYDSETEKKLVLEIVRDGDRVTVLKFSLESGTSEAALGLMAQSQKAFADAFDKLAPLIAKGAMAGS